MLEANSKPGEWDENIRGQRRRKTGERQKVSQENKAKLQRKKEAKENGARQSEGPDKRVIYNRGGIAMGIGARRILSEENGARV